MHSEQVGFAFRSDGNLLPPGLDVYSYRLMKAALHHILRTLGLCVFRERAGAVCGHRLEHDLRILVGKEDPMCLDVGANEGQTIQLLQKTFLRPMIHSFEPSSQTFKRLASREFGPLTKLHQVALGEQQATATFQNYEDSVLSSFLNLNRDSKENVFSENAVRSTEVVEIQTVDNFCAQEAIEYIDILKIDTQGFDIHVLRGARSMLSEKRAKVVITEANFSQLYEGQTDVLEVIAHLRQLGIELIDFYEKQRRSSGELAWVTAVFSRRD